MVMIVCDSAADLEPAEYEKLNVRCVPLGVSFGDRHFRENEDLSKDEFYRLLESSHCFPKTSQGSPALVEQLMLEAEKAGDELVFICLSSAISGFYQSVCALRQLLGADHCHVVDSLTATGGQRLLVEHAAMLRDRGLSAGEIARELEQLRSKVVVYACMDTLEYLYKGGRLSHLSYKVGSLANIKPILYLCPEGSCQIPGKAIGIRKGMDYLCRRLEFHRPNGKYPFYVMYTGQRDNGLKLAQRLRGEGMDIAPERIINVGAAIGSHIGPKACGFAYIEI